MDYLTYDERYWACDIEADDLRAGATRVHVVCVENVVTGDILHFREARLFQEWYDRETPYLVGHNFLSYDAPVLNRLWGTRIAATRVIDTLVMSQVYSPSLSGGHGLAKWGERLGNPKLDYHDFSRYTPQMLEYCQQDTALTADVYRALCKRMKQEDFSERCVELEHLAWNIIQNKQKQNGFPFDQQKADLLYAELREREEQLKAEIYRLWPPRLEHVRTFARGRKSNGERTANYLRHAGQYVRLEDQEDGSYHAYDYVSFDLGSPQQRIQKLLDHGWRPVNYTEKGNPKIDEDEMLAFAETSGIPEVVALSKWCVVNARANMVRNWQANLNPETGRIHGDLFLASTGRYRHSKPNTANIPGVRHDRDDAVLFGEAGTWAYECRSLWYSGGDEWDLVGIDGKGMQSRCLAGNIARYVGEDVAQEFINDLLDGDIHRKNMDRFGFPTKPAAKKAYYTILMGGGEAKICADQVQFGWEAPYDIRRKVIAGIPGFKDLIDILQAELRKTGRITLCDGMRLFVPSDHMCIPYLLQGDESRLMKQTLIFIDQEIRRRKLQKEILFVGNIHDEVQTRVRVGLADEFVDFALPCFERAGDHFNYLIPIQGDANIGKNWSQTH